MKESKFNKIFLELFMKLGILKGYHRWTYLRNVRKILVFFSKLDGSMVLNNFSFYKKHSMKFIFSTKGLIYFTKNSKSLLVISNDDGYQLNSLESTKGGKIVLVIRR